MFVILVAAIGGCTQRGEDRLPPSAAVTRDIEQWALPLDPYYVTIWDGLWEDYAINLMISECLRPTGVHFDPVKPIAMGARESSESASGRRMFSVEIAEVNGYRRTTSPDVLDEQLRGRELTAWSQELDEGQQAEFTRCLRESQKEFGDSITKFQLANNLSFEDHVGTDESELRKATDEWRRCMANRGMTLAQDVTPADMPTADLVATWASPDVPSSEEINTAISDAQCRDSSGFDAASYSAAWESESAAVAENQEELASALEGIETARARAREIITEFEDGNGSIGN